MNTYLDKLRRWLVQSERYHTLFYTHSDVVLKLKGMSTEEQMLVAQLCAACFSLGVDEGKKAGIDNRSQLGKVYDLKDRQ